MKRLFCLATLFLSLIFADQVQGQIVEIHVSLSGHDQNDGLKEAPVASVERAINLINKRKEARLNQDSVLVILHEGVYRLEKGILLDSMVSGTRNAPVEFRAALGENVIISGAKQITSYKKLPRNHILYKNNSDLAKNIIEINLEKSGINSYKKIRLTGFSGSQEPKPYYLKELHFNGRPMPLSRWPNTGFTTFKKAISNKEGITGIIYKDSRIATWTKESNLILHGYWKYLWADAYEQVDKIDTSNKILWLNPPYNHYKFGENMPFAALNALSEIDLPGEWAYDHNGGKIYFYPPDQIGNKSMEIAVCEEPLLSVNGSEWITFRNINFEKGAGEGIRITNSSHIRLENCKISAFARDGVVIKNGSDNTISTCEIFDMGRGAIKVEGGDRETLMKARFLIENCHIYNLSRIDRTYTPGIWVDGVGTHIKNCNIHDISSSAMRINGNEHLIEYNELYRVVTESDDQGAIDMWGDPTFRGNVFRYNYIYDVGPLNKDEIDAHTGRAGIRFDDAISGNLVYGNIFRNCSLGKFGAIQIHGGKENLIWNNIFYECETGVSFTPWSEKFWLNYTARSLGILERNRMLYLSKYPELVRLNEDLNKNLVVENIFMNCKATTLRMPEEVVIQRNFESTLSPKTDQKGKELPFLKKYLEDFDRIDFEMIPVDKIGLVKE